jgi:hypothetical protein
MTDRQRPSDANPHLCGLPTVGNGCAECGWRRTGEAPRCPNVYAPGRRCIEIEGHDGACVSGTEQFYAACVRRRRERASRVSETTGKCATCHATGRNLTDGKQCPAEGCPAAPNACAGCGKPLRAGFTGHVGCTGQRVADTTARDVIGMSEAQWAKHPENEAALRPSASGRKT